MKTIAAIFFFIFIATSVQAQDNTSAIKVKTIEMGIVTETAFELNLETKTQVARLYKFKNARVKKELSFSTKRNAAKMA